MFAEGGDLRLALTAIETGYASAHRRRAVDNCRMACLIHLNLVVAEHGEFSSVTEEYLQSLQQILDDDDDDSSLSAEHLLWTLLIMFKSPGHYERIWKMSRLVNIVKRARAPTWTTIEDALRAFLRMPESIEEVEVGLIGWDQAAFLQEVKDSTTADARLERGARSCEVGLLRSRMS